MSTSEQLRAVPIPPVADRRPARVVPTPTPPTRPVASSNGASVPVTPSAAAGDDTAPESVARPPGPDLPVPAAPNGAAPNGAAPNGAAPNGAAPKAAAPNGDGPNGAAPKAAAAATTTTKKRPSGTSMGRRTFGAVRELVQLMVVALVLAFMIKTVLLQAFYIPSGSMLETLQIGDRVLVEKVSFRFREPERGEIVVFRRPGLEEDGFSVSVTWKSFLEGIGLSQPDPDRDLIKRIIALPGETVELVNGVVQVNGVTLDEPYTSPETRNFPPITVPEGEYYVLGDNRTNSLDSRFDLGTIPERNIIGRSFAIIWPFGDATLDLDADYAGAGETPLPAE